MSGGELPPGAVIRAADGRWILEAGGKTLDSGKVTPAASSRSLFILKGNVSNPSMVAAVDSTGRFVIVQERRGGETTISIGFQVQDTDE